MNAPVEDLSQATKYRHSGTSPIKSYSVVKGDTLFSIALRYDLDYKKLASANNIHPPYIIKPNDIIYLKESSVQGIYPATANRNAAYPVKNPVVRESEKNTGVMVQKGVKQNSTPVSLQVVKKNEPVAMRNEKEVSGHGIVSSGGGLWIWPVSGKVIRQFSPQDALSKGIDIGAEMGMPVVSSRSGEVVYAGSGLKGYGNLIIIRHDDTYISAYAHNKTILVNEGQSVQQGDKVAEVGMSGTQTPKLHFEIREHGKPINPLKLLPTR